MDERPGLEAVIEKALESVAVTLGDRRKYAIVADAVIAALARPAEPEPGEDEAWEALAIDLSADDVHIARTLARHRPRITAAIRGSGLDVAEFDALVEAVDLALQARDAHAGTIPVDLFAAMEPLRFIREHALARALSEGKERDHG